jgi:hypothetical protein
VERVLVACGGSGERWGKYLGVPKPLIRIEGESLVSRTVRLVRKRVAPEDEVLVVGSDTRMGVFGAELVEPQHSDPSCGLDKLCAHLWLERARTTLLWGDTYYTETAVDTILGAQKTAVRFFGRNIPSDFSGKEGPELYAMTLSPEGIPIVRRAIGECRFLRARGEAGDRLCLWDVYAAVGGHGALVYCENNFFTLVHDWTEDFDSPGCYDSWTSRREASGISQERSRYGPMEEE